MFKFKLSKIYRSFQFLHHTRSVVTCHAGEIPFTASFGVAAVGHDLTTIASRHIERADEAVYAAKRDGRNRIAIAACDLAAV